jgi:putative endonuclease
MLNLFQHPSADMVRRMRSERQPCTYMLASAAYGTLYVGVTSDLLRRLHQHRSGELPGFTNRYGVHRLVWYELFGDMEGAIAREKQLKRWRRDWKINLIERENPRWDDLAVRAAFESGASPKSRDGP